MKLISWNVNGIRAALKSGLPSFLESSQQDVLCLQEVKAEPTDVEPSPFGNRDVSWNAAEKKGYSGTVIARPAGASCSVQLGMGIPEHDREGRIVTVELEDMYIVTVYTPNSQRGLARLPYRLDWDAAFLAYLQSLDARKPVACCGDFNVSHQDIDLANPKANRKNAGFTDEERQSFSNLLAAGFVDTFRALHPTAVGAYSWWTYRSDARVKNIGWRLDYWLVSERLMPRVQSASILPEVLGSDHCPVELILAEG